MDVSDDEDGDDDLGSGSENEEQDYEKQGRSWGVKEQMDVVERLPIKTATGAIKRVVTEREARAKKEDEESEEESGEGEDEEEEEEPELPELDRIRLAQEELSKLGSELIEDPEENVGNLKKLLEIQKNKHPKIKRLALATQLAVYRDIIPGYRIRPLTDAERAEKVSKEVKKLRNFEQSLVLNYKSYVDSLKEIVGGLFNPEAAPAIRKLALTALSCACTLLVSVPHFNFRSDLLQTICQRLGRRRYPLQEGHPYLHSAKPEDAGDDTGFGKCIDAIIQMFDEDESGHASMEAVQIMTGMMKRRKYKVDEVVLNSFLHLRLLTELTTLDMERLDRAAKEPVKMKKKDRLHRTKKEKKQAKEIKQIEEELAKAEHATSKEETERYQSETLKTVFSTYLTILKLRVSGLMGATLEGLAKFAHLINADLFGDLLEVLKELVRDRQLNEDQEESSLTIKTGAIREGLLCIVTAFTLLSGQAGESIGLDLSFFINYLYAILMPLSLSGDIEQSNKSLRLADPLKRDDEFAKSKLEARVNLSTEMEMVIKCFDAIFFNRHYKTVSFGTGTNNNQRMVAFAKRLALTSLHFPEKSGFAAMKILENLCIKYSSQVGPKAAGDKDISSGALGALFSTDDRVMNGVYRADIDSPELSNPQAAYMWETFLLQKHYSPRVAATALKAPLRTIGR
ncbi:nucleolar complex-associated protein-domain-containing protein [Myxozyma melibiosi]|uniref:Nucleolar complex-associated protein 3 n=1 Tax=Myxozyma melibiosi TaxID=54550 RepID=A0ABR1F8P3_9ASCO